MKLGVIGGAGVVGSAAAYYAALNNLVDEIVIYDILENYAQNHALDLDQGVSGVSLTKTSAGDLPALKGCDIILITAGASESGLASRDLYLELNLPIYMGIAEEIKSWGTYPVLISTSNPIDVLNYILYEYIGGPRSRYLAFSHNDTLRFQWAIANEIGVPTTMTQAFVLGEHGERQVPVFSSAKKKDTGEPIALTEAQRESVLTTVQSWFQSMLALKTKRTMGWTSSIGLGMMIEAIVNESDAIIPCSCIPDGEYGLSGASLGLPVKLGREGVRSIVEIPLDAEEANALHAAADKIKNDIQKGYELLK